MKTIPGWPPNTFTVCHIDETGLIDKAVQRFYGIGLVKVNSEILYDYYNDLLDIQKRVRSVFKNFEEFKYSYITNGAVSFYKEIIDLHFKYKNAMFCGLVIDKKHPNMNIPGYFNNAWDAHVRYSKMLVKNNVMEEEITYVIADRMERKGKSSYIFETELENLKQVIFAGMEESKNNLIIQVADILIGCVVLDFRMKYDQFPAAKQKLEVLNHLKSKLNEQDLSKGNSLFHPNYFSVWPFTPPHK